MSLVQIGGNECGPDFDLNGPCKMEICELTPDICACQFADFARAFLAVARDRIRFYPASYSEGLSLSSWTNQLIHSRRLRVYKSQKFPRSPAA
jgi:hypothetical protein